MRTGQVFKLVLVLAAAVAVWLLAESPVWAQCAMCKASIVNATDAESQARAVNAGVLTLLIPPLTVMGIIFGIAYRHRGAEPEQEEDDDE